MTAFDRAWDIVKMPHTLPAGTRLYHGIDRATFEPTRDKLSDFRGLRYPAWWSDSEDVARYFSERYDGTDPAIMVMDLDEDIELPTFDELREMADEYGIIWDEGPEEMAEATHLMAEPGWHIPNNYAEGSDTMFVRPPSGRYLGWLDEMEDEP